MRDENSKARALLRSALFALLALLVGGQAQAVITFKQGAYTALQTSSQSTVTVTYASAQTAGDLNVVIVGWADQSSTVTSITDSMGNSYSLAISTLMPQVASQSIYYARNISAAAAGSNVVRVTFSQVFGQYASRPDVRILEYAGLDTVNPLQATAGTYGISSTAFSMAVNVTAPSALLVAGDVVQLRTLSPGASFTSRMITTNWNIAEDRVVNSGTYQATAGLSGTSGWFVMQLAAFKANSDTQAPTAPASLTPALANNGKINLSWTSSTDNVGVTGYLLERCSGAGCTNFSQIATPSTTTYNDAGLTPGTSYSYRVRATDGAGNLSVYSNVASATAVNVTAPSALAATAVSATQMTVSWTASTDTVGVTAYLLERCSGAGCSAFAQVAAPSTTTYNDTGVAQGTSYSYRVRATDAAGNLSTYSNVATTTVPLAPPNAPVSLSAIGASSGQVSLTWVDTSTGASAATAFKIERKLGLSGTYAQIAQVTVNATSTTSYLDTGLPNGTVYYYRVRATNSGGDSAYSNEASAATAISDITAGTNTIQFMYDHIGNLVQTNAGGVTTSATYDLRGRKIAMSDPDMGRWSYAYDALGQIVQQTDAMGQVSVMKYDVLGRMTQRSEYDPNPGGRQGLTSNWYYDAYPMSGIGWDSSLLQGVNGSCNKGKGKLCFISADNDYRQVLAYDDVGRPSGSNTVIDSSYIAATTYDGSGRVDTLAYPGGFTVRNGYNSFGHLSEVRNSASSALLWRRTSVTISPSGSVVSDQLGDPSTGTAVTSTTTYSALGRLTGSTAATAQNLPIQNLTYQYDAVGNVAQRVDGIQGVAENFGYDTLNRLLQASGPNLVTRSFDYDTLGNITYKSDAGLYRYGETTCGAPHGPHAVTGISGTVNASYCYDQNGNLLSGAGRNINYTSFNLPLTIAQGSDSFEYRYSPSHERVRLQVNRASGADITIYLHPGGGSLFYEKETQSNGTVENRHYVNAAGLVGVYVTKTGASPEMRYYHRDNLGSITAISNDAGAVTESLAYEAFGKRRFPNGTPDPNNTIFGVQTDRGFTAHEHLDEIGLIHMNGRVYDPLLSRFMTADPTVQAPDNLQAYNRYSYVLNNPLGGIDPSGHSAWTSFRDNFLPAAVAIAVTILSDGTLTDAAFAAFEGDVVGPELAASIAMNVSVGSGMLGGAAYGFLSSGGDGMGTVQGALGGGLSALLFYGAGNLGFAPGGAGATAAHAAAGCLSGAALGGSCRQGALSGGVAEAAGQALPDLGSLEANVAKFAVLGGTASVLGGGKFGNGAMTGAFGYLFNCGMHPGTCMRSDSDPATKAPGYHQYEAEAVRPDGSPLTRDDIFGIVRRCPTPFQCGAPVNTGDISYVPGLGRVLHVVDESNYAVFNITLDTHTFYPGYVYRNAAIINGVPGILTYGEGTGAFGTLNRIAAPPVWAAQDWVLMQIESLRR